jgi:hypothetical protein
MEEENISKMARDSAKEAHSGGSVDCHEFLCIVGRKTCIVMCI